jgi:hypothetical protein
MVRGLLAYTSSSIRLSKWSWRITRRIASDSRLMQAKMLVGIYGATLMINEIVEFEAFREAIISLDARTLERQRELGSALAFDKTPEIVENLQSLLSSISDDVMKFAPSDTWRVVKGYAEQFSNILEAIVNFNPQQDNPSGERDALQRQLEDQYNNLYRHLAVVVAAALGIISSGSIDARLRAASEQAENLLKEARQSFAKQSEDMERILTTSRDRSAEFVSTVEAEHFGNASESYGSAAVPWLWGTFFTGLVILALAIFSLYWAASGKYEALKASSVAQVAVSKILLFGVLAYFANMCSRNYFANKHNQAVNKHRKNAILSYRSLIAPTSSPENRDVILMHAASAVFAPQDSAYVKQGPMMPDIPQTVIGSVIKGGVGGS